MADWTPSSTPVMAGWNPFTTPVNKFLLAGSWSPGICRGPTGANVERKLDERVGYGMDFAVIVFTGRKLAEFSTEIILVTPQDWDDWQSWRELIHAVPTRGPVSQTTKGYTPGKSLQIWHPQLVPLGITQCVVMNEPQEEIQEDMTALINIKFKQVVISPKQAYAKPEAPADAPPLSPMEQEIENKRRRNALASQEQVDAAAGGPTGTRFPG